MVPLLGKRTTSGALVLVIALALVAVEGVGARADDPPRNGATGHERRLAEEFFHRLNDERAERRLEPLAWDRELTTAASDWARQMGNRSEFAHRPSGDLTEPPWEFHQFYRLGENVAYARTSGYATVGLVHRGWMQSEAHRDNMLHPSFHAVGIGVYCDADGTLWAVQNFGSHSGAPEGGAGGSTSEHPVVHDDDGGPGCGSVHPSPRAQAHDHQLRRFSDWERWAERSTRADATRLGGQRRTETAAAIAEAGWPAGAEQVVIARGTAFADALAGAYLAGVLDAPVLLSVGDRLHADTADAVAALGAREAFVLGGPSAVPDAVLHDLGALGLSVERVAGGDRLETAAAIAERGVAAASGEAVGRVDGRRTALLASAWSWPDALVAGALAAGERFPVVLTGQDALHDAARETLEALGIEHVIVLGGPAVVGDAVIGQLGALGIDVRRLGGDTRVHTAVEIAGWALGEDFGWAPERAVIVSGQAFADALAIGPFAGARRTPVLLAYTEQQLGATEDWLRAEACGLTGGVWLVGGAAALDVTPAYLAQQAATCLDDP